MSVTETIPDFSDVAIIVVAAGRGTRTGPGLPKQYRLLAGRPLIAITLDHLAAGAPGARILPVIDESALDLYRASITGLSPQATEVLQEPVFGGATRQETSRLGLESSCKTLADIKIVLIHDAARLFPSATLIQNAIRNARRQRASVPGLKISDTIKQVNYSSHVVATPDREPLRAVQTPQAFDFALILDAHRRAAAAGVSDLTDDAAVAGWAGNAVHVFEGESGNLKVTTMDDFIIAEARLLSERPDIRTGQGFDVHAFCEGDHVWLGGVKVPHSHALSGHSDADVLMHAITDALYGALAEGDIGAHFPPSDPQWKGAASAVFLRHAAARVAARGGLIAHVDATVICETPKVGPHRDAIRARLAEIMQVSLDRVAVKATTTEHLGFTGRGEGIAAMASASVRLPNVP